MLEAFLMPVVNSASHSNKSVAKEDLRTLHFLLQHLNVATHGGKAADLIPLLLNHFPEDDIELRNTSISIFGLLLNGLKDKHKVSRNTLNSWVSFMTWWDVPTSLFNYEMYTSLHSMYSNIGFVVMNKCKENIPEMLAQILGFLRSRNSSHRKAAALLIGCCVQYMKPDVVTSKEIEEVFLSLRGLQGDCEASVAQTAADSMEKIFRQWGHRINPDLNRSQLQSHQEDLQAIIVS